MYKLIRISDDGNWACVFSLETGQAFVCPALKWKYEYQGL